MTEKLNEFKDINLICKSCGEKFVFTASEQKFYARQGFTNAPVRCKDCRLKFQEQKFKGAQVYNVKCVKCALVGKITTPVPHPNKVYCENCFNEELEKEKQIKGSLPSSIYEAMRRLGIDTTLPVESS